MTAPAAPTLIRDTANTPFLGCGILGLAVVGVMTCTLGMLSVSRLELATTQLGPEHLP